MGTDDKISNKVDDWRQGQGSRGKVTGDDDLEARAERPGQSDLKQAGEKVKDAFRLTPCVGTPAARASALSRMTPNFVKVFTKSLRYVARRTVP